MSLIPLYIHVIKQSIQTDQEIESTHILYDGIQRYLLEGSREDEIEIARGERIYNVVWNIDENRNSSEVCIYYEDIFNKSVQKCETIEE